MITIIAAVAKNRAIGFKNKLIYWLPNDLKRFKALTTGHTIIMGRNTFLSRNTKAFEGCDVYPSLEEALAHCTSDEDIYIIGGASVYRQAMKIADRLCLTEINDTPAEADTFFPPYDEGWQEESREDHPIDDRHDFPYSFVNYIRAEPR